MKKGWDNEELRQKADQGDPDAQYELGRRLAYGKGMTKDHAAAEKWFRAAVEKFRSAAEKGAAEAQLQLGRMHEYGHGLPADPAAAFS